MSENGVVEKKSTGQTAKGLRKSMMAEPSKPITMFLHDEDRIKELFKGLKIADCSRLSLPIEEEESGDLDACKYSNLSIWKILRTHLVCFHYQCRCTGAGLH